MQHLRTRYVDAALQGDRASAASLATRLLIEDLSPREVIVNLLARSQAEIGRRWQEQICSIGQEHAATSVTEAVLASITVGYEPAPTSGHFVMVCADGEWHSLPAKMAAELLILEGWRVTMVGAAIPIDHLRCYLADIDADVVGVSCTLTTNLPGAGRSIRAARNLGFSVIAGGRAFGSSPRRARALGADGWADTIDIGFRVEELMWDRIALAELDGEWAHIERNRSSITERAFDFLTETHQSLPIGGGGWLDSAIGDLDEMVGVAIAASLCNDVEIIADHADWWRSRLAAHGLPEAAAAVGFEAVAVALEDFSTVTAAMITDVAQVVARQTRRLQHAR